MSKITLEPDGLYEFKQLAEYLSGDDSPPGTFLLVENMQLKERAIMHIFTENFCGPWRSGHVILFYADGEATSANEYDEFRFISMHHPDINIENYG